MENDGRDSAGSPAEGAVDVRGDVSLVLQAEPLLPVMPTPDTLIRVFRLLRERIPGFTQLSVEEERSMIRASHLDPEFIADGMLAADAWEQAQLIAKMSVEEMRELDAAIRHWDDLEKELLVTARGIAGANRTRRYRLGKAILQLYFTLGIAVKDPRNSHLIPYYERMKRSYMKNRKKRGTRAKTAEPDAPES